MTFFDLAFELFFDCLLSTVILCVSVVLILALLIIQYLWSWDCLNHFVVFIGS